MADIFREIDEELRQEKAERLWKRYGKYMIAGAVVIVVAFAAFSGWREYRQSQEIEAGAKFAAAKALVAENKPGDAEALFTALGAESDTTYGVLARFHAAALRAEAGDREGAARAYRALAGNADLDQPFRNLSTILAAQIEIDLPGADRQALVAEVKPLAEQGSAWRHAALEVLGLLAHKDGKLEEARSYFRRIADDIDAPANVRGRATQILGLIGNP